MKLFIRGIKNLIKWFPIIWKDEDFEYDYLLKILEFKLQNMEQYFNSNNTWAKYGKKYAKQIMIVKNLIKRIRKEYYPFDFNNLYNDKNWDKIHKRDEYMINQDFEYLGLMLKKHLRKWWD